MLFYAQDLITDAARAIWAIADGETLNQSEYTDGLNSLNKLVDAWGALGILNLQLAEFDLQLNGLTQPYSLGFRPAKITAAACNSGTIMKPNFPSGNGSLTSPIEILSSEQWSQITDLSRSGKFATKLFCDYADTLVSSTPVTSPPTMVPSSNISWWPEATGVLNLYYYPAPELWQDLDITPINLIAGFADALTLNLALRLAEQYGKPVTQSLMQTAMAAQQVLATANMKIFGNDPIPDQPAPQSPGKQSTQAQ